MTYQFSEDDIKTIITEYNIDGAKKLVEYSDNFGKHLAKVKKLKTTQIRNAYGSMKKLEMTGWNHQTAQSLLLLKPRLAYAAGRHGGGVEDLKHVITKAIDFIFDDEINKDEKMKKQSFQRFCQFFEAIVAYHKCYGGN
jgi:CRISPR-associated protein Csm2